eukprot:1152680-Pelagomonas_calceolata.AAC.2
MEKIQAALIETERLGERFLDVRQKAVALDRQRQENREALTAFRKQPSAQHKAWMRLRGGILVKFHMQQAKDVLQAGSAVPSTSIESNGHAQLLHYQRACCHLGHFLAPHP